MAHATSQKEEAARKVAAAAAVGCEDDAGEVVGDEPVSPTGQYFNSSVLSVSIMVAFEIEIPIDDSPAMAVLQNLFLPINPRFSSIMVRDKRGVQRWRRVKVNLEDHVRVPVFPPGLPVEAYDERTREYLSRLAMEPLPQHRPLWELHIIKYPTRSAAGTLVFKLHHALGDGFSLMGALFSCLRRADDPSLPLTFPASSRLKSAAPGCEEEKTNSVWRSVSRVLSVGFNTASEFAWSLFKSNLVGDDESPVRSGHPGVEFRPVTISSVTFSLDDIGQIKSGLGGTTINEVVTGIIFYGTQLYLHRAGGKSTATTTTAAADAANVTALVLLNTREISTYQTLTEMNRPGAKSPWGNRFGFMHASIPRRGGDLEAANPLDFVFQAKEIIRRKRSSLAVYLTGWLLEMLRRFRGPEVTAKYIHATLRNTSMTISNLIGPLERMHIANHPVRSFYFMVLGSPQSLTITMVSYMGKLRVAFGTESGFIDSKLLVLCMEKAFARIFEEAVGKKG